MSCSKSLAISLETVLPEETWMTQIGRTLPRMFDFRSVLALDHNENMNQLPVLALSAILPFCHSGLYLQPIPGSFRWFELRVCGFHWIS